MSEIGADEGSKIDAFKMCLLNRLVITPLKNAKFQGGKKFYHWHVPGT